MFLTKPFMRCVLVPFLSLLALGAIGIFGAWLIERQHSVGAVATYLAGASAIVMIMAISALVDVASQRAHVKRHLAMHAFARDCRIPYILMLRSFREADLYVRRTLTLHMSEQPVVFEGTENLIETIEAGLRAIAPLVLVSDYHSEGSIGSRTIVIEATDESWHDAYRQLATSARAILVIPETSPSLRWEIGEIATSQLLAKTLFVMPPTVSIPEMASFPPFEPNRDREIREWNMARRRRWEVVREAYRATGIELPPYQESGAVFTMSADGVPQTVTPIGEESEESILAAVGTTLSAFAPTPDAESLADAYSRLCRFWPHPYYGCRTFVPGYGTVWTRIKDNSAATGLCLALYATIHVVVSIGDGGSLAACHAAYGLVAGGTACIVYVRMLRMTLTESNPRTWSLDSRSDAGRCRQDFGGTRSYEP